MYTMHVRSLDRKTYFILCPKGNIVITNISSVDAQTLLDHLNRKET